MKKKHLNFIFSLVFLYGCVVDVDLELPLENSIVLNGLLVPGDTISVSLHRSDVNTDTTGFEEIRDAAVTLFENGEALGSLNYQGNGIYQAETLAKELTAYKVVVETPEGEEAWAETKTPECDFNASIITPNEIDSSLSHRPFFLTFTDNLDFKNSYWVCVFISQYIINPDTVLNYTKLNYTLYSNSVYADPFNVTYNYDGGGDYCFEHNKFILYDDSNFDGKTVTVDFRNYYDSWKNDSVVVFNMDEHYSNYLKSKIISEEGGEYITDDMPPLNYVPSFLYTNVHNGMGILGAYSCYVKVYDYLRQ
jgi:hypothetical protein